jgi:hypothetical protein
LWYAEPSAVSNAIGYAIQHSRSHDAVIRIYDDAGNVIETQGHIGDVKVCHRRFLHTLICAKATRAKVVALSISRLAGISPKQLLVSVRVS